MEDLDDRIRQQNQWWADRRAMESDPYLEAYRGAPAQWDPPAFHSLPLASGHTHTLRGPRQVGKTTTVKRLIAQLVAQGHPRVLYFSFDLETDPASLYHVVSRAKVLHPEPEGPWHIFLDEVTSVPDWQRGIKHAWDSGLTRRDFILVTGSSAHDVKRGAEQLPGRRGDGRDFLQLPMSFRDFCRTTGAVHLPDETVPVDALLTKEGRRLVRALNLRLEQLTRAFDAYRRVGGFPAAVAEHVDRGGVRPETIRLLWHAIAGDISKSGRNQVAAAKLLEQVSISLGSPLKWSGAANAMDVASQTTAKQYAEFLAEAFALLLVYFWDLAGGTLRPQKQRKAYFVDPLLAEIPALLIPGARRAADDGLVENLVGLGLFRSAAATLVQAGPTPGSIAYWRSTSDREIDFLVPRSDRPARRFAVEVKGDSRPRITAARKAIRQSFNSGVIATATIYEDDEQVPALPVPVLLVALNDTPERTAALT